MLKAVRESFKWLLLVGAEEFVRNLIPHLLPVYLLLILVYATWEVLELQSVRARVKGAYLRLRPKQKMFSYLIVFAAGGVLLCLYWFVVNTALGAFHLTPQAEAKSTPPSSPATERIAVYPAFRSAHQSRRKELGDPRRREMALGVTYYGQYESAAIIWIKGDTMYSSRLYVLSDDNTWKKFSVPAHQRTSTTEEEKTWYSDECNRKRFGTPQGTLPPYAGIAWQLAQDREDGTSHVPRLGGRQWHVQYDKGVYIQEFDNGFIIGPFSPTENASDTALVFAFTNNGEWVSLTPAFHVLGGTKIAPVNANCNLVTKLP